MQVARWQATSEAGRTALIPAERLALYGAMYTFLHRVNEEMAKEQDYWAELRSLEHLGQLSPGAVFGLTATLQRARYSNFRMEVWTRQVTDLSNELGLRRVANEIASSRSACIPMNTPRATAIEMSNSFLGIEP